MGVKELFRQKTATQVNAELAEPGTQLRRVLEVRDLVFFGISVVIGAGIFSLTARVAGEISGPATPVSLLIAALVCGYAGYCYAESAALIPLSGGAYSYSYVAFGEIVAWLIGWNLILEYTVGAATVAQSWSGYLAQFLRSIGLPLHTEIPLGDGYSVHWAATLLLLVVAAVLYGGISLSSMLNKLLTAAKVLAILVVIAASAFAFDGANYQPFFPPTEPAPPWSSTALSELFGGFGAFGAPGLLTGAALLFFAYIGLDMVTTTAEEVRSTGGRQPGNLKRGLYWSLGISTVLYVAVAVVLIGAVKYTRLRVAAGEQATLATAFESIGAGWLAFVVTLGALLGLISVVLALLVAQSRVCFRMSRDGLLPDVFGRVGRQGAPSGLVPIGVLGALIALLAPPDMLAQLANAGTLFVFVFVAWGMPGLRSKAPSSDAKNSRARILVLRSAAGVFSMVCLALALSLTVQALVVFGIVFAAGLASYFAYPRRHARLGAGGQDSPAAGSPAPDRAPRQKLTTGRYFAGLKPYTPVNPLPRVKPVTWFVLFAGCLLGLVGVVFLARDANLLFVRNAPGDTAAVAIRSVVGIALVAGLVVGGIYAYWRFRLELLAGKPGPIRVVPFLDQTVSAGAAPSEQESTALAVELTASLQYYLVRTQIYGSTAIPPSGSSSDFLRVIETAGAGGDGPWSALSRLPRLFVPTHSYEVACTVLPDSADPGVVTETSGGCVLLVELTRLPKYQVAPKIFRGTSWARVVERAAHWVAGVVLPRTRQCRRAPWTLWRGLRLPDDLFDLYQRFQFQRRDRQFDAAMASLREAITVDPTNLALRLEQGKLQEQLDMHLDALATYDDIIERASRTDRALASVWHFPATPVARVEEGGAAPATSGAGADDESDAEDAAWFETRLRELPVGHPVVYVARYRHMLLLGLGDRLADQWWRQPRDTCRTGSHVSARERRRDYARSTLSERFSRRYRWVHDAIRPRPGPDGADADSIDAGGALRGRLSSNSMDAYLSRQVRELPQDPATTGGSEQPQDVGQPRDAEQAQDREKTRNTEETQEDWKKRRLDAYLFFTTAAVASWELLYRERITGLFPSPRLSRVVSVRSLRLVASWTVLRAALAFQHAQDVDGRTLAHRDAARSVLTPSTDPWVLDEAGRRMLETWPPSYPDLAAHVDDILYSRFRTLFSWHEHYNAACVFALSLLHTAVMAAGPGRRDRRDMPPEAVQHPQADSQAARAAIRQLTKAAACGNSAFLASQRDWMLAEDPDLDVLRSTPDFRDLEAATFGTVRGAVARGPRLVVWQLRTFVSDFVGHVARAAADGLQVVLDDRLAWPSELYGVLQREVELWALVESVTRDHRDSPTRHDAITRYAAVAGRWNMPAPQLQHPRFTRARFAQQCAALHLSGPFAPHTSASARSSIAKEIDDFLERATDRLSDTARLLRFPQAPGSCCLLDEDLVIEREFDVLTAAVPGTFHADSAELPDVERWLRRNLLRWRALAEYFDDSTKHTPPMRQRWAALKELLVEWQPDAPRYVP